MTDVPKPGWYPDPEQAGQLRWFDGTAWTESRRPRPDGEETTAGASGSALDTTGDPTLDVPGEPLFGAAVSPPTPPARPTAPPVAPPAPSAGFGPPAGSAPPAPRRRSRKGWFVAGGLAVVAVVVVVIVLVGFGGSKPTFTWNGKAIDDPSETIKAADSAFLKEAKSRSGATNSDSRCYFSKPEKASGDAKPSDINGYLRCGPVLFADGSTKAPWLTYELRASDSGKKVTLRASSSPQKDTPSGLSRGEKLERPDGKSAPDGAGGLKVPPPPPADPGVFEELTTADAKVSPAPAPIVVQAFQTGVQINGFGVISRYGHGPDARRAAKGQKLVAAQLRGLDGESEDALGDSSTSATGSPSIQVVVDGQTTHDVADLRTSSDEIVVVGVPESVKSVDLVIKDGDTSQSVSLLTGTPSQANPKVLSRKSPYQDGGGTTTVPLTLTKPGYVQNGPLSVTLTVRNARLTWFGGPNADQHPPAPAQAFLRLKIDYSWSDGTTGTLGAGELFLSLPNGQIIAGVDLDPDPGFTWLAFPVPWNFTTGTVLVRGSDTTPDGITATISQEGQLPVAIPAG